MNNNEIEKMLSPLITPLPIRYLDGTDLVW